MKTTMYGILFILVLAIGVMAGNIIYYIYKPEPLVYNIINKIVSIDSQKVTNWNADYEGVVIQLPKEVEKYDCRIMEVLIGDPLIYCTLKDRVVKATGLAYVSGEFSSNTNSIMMDYKASDLVVIHETTHYTMDCIRKNKDEELCVRNQGKILTELGILK